MERQYVPERTQAQVDAANDLQKHGMSERKVYVAGLGYINEPLGNTLQASDSVRVSLRTKIQEALNCCTLDGDLGEKFHERLREIRSIYDIYTTLKGLGM